MRCCDEQSSPHNEAKSSNLDMRIRGLERRRRLMTKVRWLLNAVSKQLTPDSPLNRSALHTTTKIAKPTHSHPRQYRGE